MAQSQAPQLPPTPLLAFKVLQLGNVVLLGYLGIIGTLSCFGLSLLNEQIYRWSSILLGQFGASPSAIKYARDLLLIVPVIIALPLVLTTVPLATRLIWIQGKLPLNALLSLTLPSFQKVVQTIYFSSKRAGYLVIPVVALFALYHLVIKPNQSPAAILFFYGTCIVVALIVLARTIPLLCSPLVSVVGQYHPGESMLWSQKIYEGSVKYILATIIPGSATLAGIHLGFHHGTWAPRQISPLEGVLLGLVIWYVVTTLSLITIKRISELTKQRAPSPYQKTP